MAAPVRQPLVRDLPVFLIIVLFVVLLVLTYAIANFSLPLPLVIALQAAVPPLVQLYPSYHDAAQKPYGALAFLGALLAYGGVIAPSQSLAPRSMMMDFMDVLHVTKIVGYPLFGRALDTHENSLLCRALGWIGVVAALLACFPALSHPLEAALMPSSPPAAPPIVEAAAPAAVAAASSSSGGTRKRGKKRD